GGNTPGNFIIAYYASTDTIFGNADDVLVGTETIAPGAGGTVGTHTGTALLEFENSGTYYLFDKLDSPNAIPETDETNNVTQAAQPVVVSGPVVIDNGQPGYSETGTWTTYTAPGAGYNNNLRYSAAGDGSS